MRLADLLGDTPPGMPPINISVGEPQHPVPPFVAPILAKHTADFGRYPGNAGTDRFRQAVAGWLNRRYALARPIEPLSEVLVLGGSREGLFLAAIAAKRFAGERPGKPAILVPNPFYAPYSAGAVAAECEPVYLDATAENGFLPDLDALSNDLLARTVAFYLASPANPQGSVASREYLARARGARAEAQLHAVRRRVLLGDLLEGAAGRRARGRGQGLRQRRGVQLALQALQPARPAHRVRRGRQALHQAIPRSARRVGAAGAGARRRKSQSPPIPTRRMSRRTARSIAPSSTSPTRSSATATATSVRPVASSSGSTCRSTAAARPRRVKLWKEAGLRVVPGNYAARPQANGFNAGEGYIRVAMVQDRETTAEALHRMVKVLG